MSFLKTSDPAVYNAIMQETTRLKETIDLIASENYTSKAVLEAQGSVFTNKYAEGYPGKRYYAGCEYADAIEELAIDRAKTLFHAEHANVQPHSGAQANMAAYFAMVKPGDTIMGLTLSHGGHLTHGSKANFTGKLYHVIEYGLNAETERIDYDNLEKLALEHRPRLIVTGASAYPRILDFERFRAICDKVDAKLMVDIAHIAGLVAAGLHPSPVPYADVVTSTSHKTLRGPRGGFILCKEQYAKAIDQAVFPVIQGGPLMQVVAAKAVAFQEAMQPGFVTYQKKILENTQVMAEELRKLGLRLVSGGTDNHLVLVDLSPIGVNGYDAQLALRRAGIVINRNTVPFAENQTANVPAGIRLGCPAATSRGFGPAEIRQTVGWIGKILKNIGNEDIEKQVLAEVIHLCRKFPVPGIDA
ncbi:MULTISPECIES: serine hydroxymethyltransferase [Dehalococcoides]|uniref:Serine hydroxymethyltransferase n=1 Tax=Dehalococcoides mccartyi TaxID=61435 RepID=A0AB38ZBC9_9CHLR|nr:serine hydroxymethyltransferase [Dehalococcoides mccartyi]MDN4185978.1 serine hydroxymethyltransferase [Dehalococcoides mccartyi]WRO07889.1 serine hydroxymethyltransferase [Dehalococcoides mccartyi]